MALQPKNRVDACFLPRIAQIICDTPGTDFVNPYASAADSKPVTKLGYMLNANNAQGVNALIGKMEYYAAGYEYNWNHGLEPGAPVKQKQERAGENLDSSVREAAKTHEKCSILCAMEEYGARCCTICWNYII